MKRKSVKLKTDNVIEAFYDAIRKAVEAHYGRPFTLEHVERAMKLEGWVEGERDN